MKCQMTQICWEALTQQAADLQLAPWQYPPSLHLEIGMWRFFGMKLVRLIQLNFSWFGTSWCLNMLMNMPMPQLLRSFTSNKTKAQEYQLMRQTYAFLVRFGIRPLRHHHPRLHPAIRGDDGNDSHPLPSANATRADLLFNPQDTKHEMTRERERRWEWLIYTQTQSYHPILLSHSTQPNLPTCRSLKKKTGKNPTNAGAVQDLVHGNLADGSGGQAVRSWLI